MAVVERDEAAISSGGGSGRVGYNGPYGGPRLNSPGLEAEEVGRAPADAPERPSCLA